MEEKYILNESIYYYSDDGELILLKDKELISNNYEELKKIFDNAPGEFYKGEFEPEFECIKYSIMLTSANDNMYFSKMIEKYIILEIKEVFHFQI